MGINLVRLRTILLSLHLVMLIVLALTLPARSRGIDLILPTSNDGIFTGCDSTFYQRTTSGRKEPWRGGTYGFTRNPRSTSEGMIFTRYHAGIDIAPLYRDEKGRPLDSIRAVANGVVVHTSPIAGRSNYGKYLVIEHNWSGSPYYSLYAHLSEIWVEPGDSVRQGRLIGRMGYTGAGINRERAHLHFEINLLINENFHGWYAETHGKDTNQHGIYNGINLVAVDAARLYLELRDNPHLTMKEFLEGEEAFFEVLIPIAMQIDMLRRYPWLLASQPDVHTTSWAIAFTNYGLPLRIDASEESVDDPVVRVIEQTGVPYRWLTKSLLVGQGETYSLSNAGERYIDLMIATTGNTPSRSDTTAENEIEFEEESF